MQGICSLAPLDWALKLLRDSVAVFVALLLLAVAVFLVVLLVGLLIALRGEQFQFRKGFAASRLFRAFHGAPKVRAFGSNELKLLLL
jgi:hypothetical protein